MNIQRYLQKSFKQIQIDRTVVLKPNIFSNIANTAQLVLSNVADDPTYFALQVARRFRSRPILRQAIDRLSSERASLSQRALAAMLTDDRSCLRSVCEQYLQSERSSRQSVFFANLCIASDEWILADKLLDQAAKTKSAVKSRARLLWARGHMSEAIAVLGSGYGGRQLRHYRSEFSVFRGLEPNLPATQETMLGAKKCNSIMYVATNSLPHTGSGYAQRTHSILKALVDEGWAVKALTRVNYPLNIGKLAADLQDIVDGITYERCLPFPAQHDFAGRIQQQAEDLLARVKKDNPSVLHTTTDFSNALAVKAVAEATGIPWIYEVRGQLADTWLSTRPDGSETSERYQLFMERESYVARHADHVFTLGEAMKQNLIRSGVKESKISLLPNGIGDEFLEEPVDRTQAREQLGLDPEAFYAGTVSSLVPYEGLSTLVRAVARLADEFLSLRLLIVGDGTDRENLIMLARELGIESRCEFPGRVPREQAHLYHSSLNTFAVPRVESAVTRSVTPLKPVEALASGVPVLASDLPALRELITDGENGHLVRPEDVEDWTGSLRTMILEPSRAHKMGKSGREFVLSRRTWAQNAKTIIQIYCRVVNQTS